MGLTICNGTNARIAVTIMFYDPNGCGGDGQNFQMSGWWQLDPHTCWQVYENDLADVNRYWFVYADGGGLEWAGPWVRTVPAYGFTDLCWGFANSGLPPPHWTARYFRVDVGESDDYILTLAP